MGLFNIFKRFRRTKIQSAVKSKAEAYKNQEALKNKILKIIFSTKINPAIKNGEMSCKYEQYFNAIPDFVVRALRDMDYKVECFPDPFNNSTRSILISWDK